MRKVFGRKNHVILYKNCKVLLQKCLQLQFTSKSIQISNDGGIEAMNKYQADYGVFITNSRFTNQAREAARAGTPITLIDGNDLIRLVIRYELFITPVTTYVLDEFYLDE